ncbi:MAG TPA: aromatic ring-hydroxylating dioxygenase subunit alpha [Myxococcaceae bacterium]|nr:aromatic ring-hydroxylating dioxygenase subunit alpha [Myxococcaceae bacterium]
MSALARPYQDAFLPYWHPVAFSRELTAARPLSARLLESDLVLWRSPAGVRAARRYCAHRGADLSSGEVADGALVCPFHGWTYGPDGRCIRIPSQPSAPIPEGARVDAFLAAERYGLVWVCLAAEPLAPMPHWPELEAEGERLKTVELPRLEWDASAGRMMEIVLDVAHLSWVHRGTFGNPGEPEVAAYEVERRPGGLGAQIHYPALAPSVNGAPPRIDRTSLTYDVTFPFAVRLAFQPTLFYAHTVYAVASPLSEEAMHCYYFASYDARIRNFSEMFVRSEMAILEQDRRVLEAQRPKAQPLGFVGEIPTRADRLAVEYRRELARLRGAQPPTHRLDVC